MEQNAAFLSNGKTLKGTLRKPDGASVSSPVPCVVILHGFCDERNELNFVHRELAQRLEEEGIGSFRFDFNGSGESEGRFEDMTISSEIEDAQNALAFVQDLDWVDDSKIGLHGLSLGGCVASMTAGRNPESIAALSLWCPAADLPYNLRKKLLLGLDVSDVEEKGYMDVEGLKCGVGFYRDAIVLDPYAEAARYTGPVNLVHGSEDITASPECSLKYKEIFGDRANLLIVDGAEHRFTTCEYRQARMESAVSFLSTHLNKER